MKSQKEAVCELLLSVLNERGVEYELNGKTSIKSVLTSDDKKKVCAIIVEGFKEGLIDMSETSKAKYINDDQKLKTYVNGLINNWIKKNPEFNSGVKYKPKNPGSHAGRGDAQVKAMRQLKIGITDEEVLKEIDEAITERIAEISPKAELIDVEALPEHLRHLVK